jgi:hypothetical protein
VAVYLCSGGTRESVRTLTLTLTLSPKERETIRPSPVKLRVLPGIAATGFSLKGPLVNLRQSHDDDAANDAPSP